jgi:hypothetical protein
VNGVGGQRVPRNGCVDGGGITANVSVGWRQTFLASRERVANAYASASVGAYTNVRHIAGNDAGVVRWRATPTHIGGRQVCGVPFVCCGITVYGGRATTSGDHEYASGSEAGLIASGTLSLSREECYTCTPCGIRLTSRN